MKVYEQQILQALDSVGGFTTGDVAIRVHNARALSPRQHSALVRSHLLALQGDGKVKPLDDKKPVVWVKVKGGQP